MAAAAAVEHAQVERPPAGAAGRRSPSRIWLEDHPEVGVCTGCAQWLHRRARSAADDGRTPSPVVRRGSDFALGRVLHAGAQDWPARWAACCGAWTGTSHEVIPTTWASVGPLVVVAARGATEFSAVSGQRYRVSASVGGLAVVGCRSSWWGWNRSGRRGRVGLRVRGTSLGR